MKDDGRVRKNFHCPNCEVELKKTDMDRLFQTEIDPVSGEPTKQLKRKAVLIDYDVGEEEFEKEPDSQDRELLAQIRKQPLSEYIPTDRFPIEQMYHGSRIEPKGVERIHQAYMDRSLRALGKLWSLVEGVKEPRLRNMLFFLVDQAIWGMSVMNRYVPTHYSHTNQYLSGVYYIGSQHAEVSPWYNLENKLQRMVSAFSGVASLPKESSTSTGNAAVLSVPDNSVDFIFTDPPFGENIFYADMNYLVESWYRVWTNTNEEAIVDQAKGKNLRDYQGMMTDCFAEYYRVLKPNRWMTVVFHNSHNRVWHAIQEALQQAGFVVADVRTLDKQQGSFRQITSDAAKQDLIISCYKPAQYMSFTNSMMSCRSSTLRSSCMTANL